MRVVGLTGGIASGKSTVSRILREFGAEVIDADQVAKDVVRPGEPAWAEIARAFGPEVLGPDRSIDRRRLGQIVFGSPALLAQLNAIVHPRVIERITERVAEARARGRGVLVIEAPLLIEAGMTDLVDEVWLVTVDPKTQLGRLMARDHFSFQEALNRLNAQLSQEEKRRFAHRTIDNDGPLSETRRIVESLWRDLLRRDPDDPPAAR